MKILRQGLRATLLCAAATASLQGQAQGDGIVQSADAASRQWLALLDNGDGAGSWQQAAPLFQGRVPQTQWEQASQAARGPLGRVRERTLKSAQLYRTLPGAPDGEYVVIQYETAFDNKERAVEMVTPMHQPDGSWKVSGYFVK